MTSRTSASGLMVDAAGLEYLETRPPTGAIDPNSGCPTISDPDVEAWVENSDRFRDRGCLAS